MADSKFLRFQDVDNDGLIDVCDDLITTPETPCKGPCTPNPAAINPQWKDRDINEPFLNEKKCYYQVTKVTPHSTIQTDVDVNFKEFKEEAVDSLLNFYDKDDGFTSKEKVRNAMIFDRYDLDPHPNTRLKLLYSVPFDVIYELPDSVPEDEPFEDEEPGTVKVTFNAAQLTTQIIRVRTGLGMYGRLLKVYRSIGEGNAYYKANRTIFNLDDYGDMGLWSDSTMKQLMNGLEGFLDAKDYRLPGQFWGAFSSDRLVTKLKFVFDDYELKSMRVWTIACGNKPRYFGKKKLRPLRAQGPWKDKTAVAYFTKLPEMARAFNARVQVPWQDFVEKYTYPKVFFDIKEGNTEKTIGSCVADALADEFKELGQDILDEVFTIGDAIAYLWRKSICRDSINESLADDFLAGTYPGAGTPDMTKAFGMGKEQAFGNLSKDDNVFVMMCMSVAASSSSLGSVSSMMGTMYKFGFQRIKICGLFDLLGSVIQCLTGGLTLDEALSTMLEAALKNMGIEQFGDLFGGLPAHKQRELGAMVEKQLREGSFFSNESVAIQKPWENQAVIDKERENMSEDNFEGMTPTPNSQVKEPKYERTLVEQNDKPQRDTVPVDKIMQAYISALLEYYSEDFFELLDELNRFPGAQIIAAIIGSLDCPHPPLLNPSFPDFIKSIIFPFCTSMSEFSLPRLETPLQYYPDFADITAFIWYMAKKIVMQIVWRILMILMAKICELIGNAICKALEVTGAVIGALPGAMAGTADLGQVIKDTICGPEADDKQVEDTILDLMSQLGLGSAAFADRDRTLQFGLDLSSSLTTAELQNALLGNPSPIFLEIVDHLIEYEYPEFREGIQNRTAIGRFFKNIGNLVPIDARAKLEDAANENIWGLGPAGEEGVNIVAANPSMCSTPEQIEQFKALRCELLEGRATPEQCHEMFCDMREGTLEDLGDLSDILQGGLGNHIVKNMPPLVSEPGCDDGIFPWESPQMADLGVFALSGDLEMLKIDYGKDMMGNGNFWNSDSQWGFMNMMLSDTQAFALTSHHSKTSNEKAYVNYATNLPNGGEATSGFFSFFQSSQGFSGQIGQYPYYVGEGMKRQFLNAGMPSSQRDNFVIKPGFYSLTSMGNDLRASIHGSGYGFRSSNGSTGTKKYYVDFEKLQYNNFFGSLTQGINLFMVPDFGYNTSLRANMNTEQVEVTREIRKGTGIKVNGGNGSHSGKSLYSPAELGCDIVLDFRDNAAGMRLGGKGKKHPVTGISDYISTNEGGKPSDWAPGGKWGTEWSYGYEIQCYFNDIHKDETGNIRNRFDDNIRLDLIEKVNYGSDHMGPLGKAMEDEMTKMAPFDLPNWIEGIPIVGWAIESVINLILMPFTQLIVRAVKVAALRASEEVHRIREFEFISVDDGLDVFFVEPDPEDTQHPKLSDYPSFSRIKNSLTSESPPVLLLSDMTGLSESDAKARYDSTMNSMFQKLAYEIGDAEDKSGGWLYGADYDYLTQDDTLYGVKTDAGEFVPYYLSGYEEEDMVLGISWDQYMNPKNPRVIYLNPAIYGGSYSKPPLHIKPLQYKGWMGFVQVFFPESTACKPHSVDLVDFGEIESFIQEHFPKMADDPRLTKDPECVREVPFKRIMTRAGKTGMYSLVMAAIRVYASTHLFKAMGTFSQIMPKFPDNFSSIYSSYIVERIEEDFRDAPDGFWGWAQSFKDDEFWYGFLEQSVECYDFLVDAGEIETPKAGGYLQNAFDTINDLQTEYEFPMRPTQTRNYVNSEGEEKRQRVMGLWDAKIAGEAGWFQSLKGYRSDENFEAIQSVEEHAKLILQQLVNFELTKMGKRLVENMRQYGFNPRIFDLDYYAFTEMNASNSGGGGAPGSVNGPLHFAGPEAVDIIQALPTPDNPDPRGEGVSWPGPYYTKGAEFRVAIDNDSTNEFSYADEYVGYYHGHIDEEGDVIYMVGEQHTGDAQDVLTPVDNLVAVGTVAYIEERVNIDEMMGDSSRGTLAAAARERQSSPYPKMKTEKVYIGTVPALGETSGGSESQPYAIEQYVSVNGTKMTPSTAKATIMAQDTNLRISDVYPGTLQLVHNDAGIEVGIKGNIGVRYGLAFYYMDGMKKLITTVEVDSLDVKIGQWNVMQPSSKLLMCLLNKLKEDERYKLMTDYIFPLNKVTAIWAIYNDFGIMSSLGEVTCGSGDDTMWLPTGVGGALLALAGIDAGDIAKPSDWLSGTPFTQVKVKPGSRAYIHRDVLEKEYKWGDMSEAMKDALMPFRVPWFDDSIEYEIISFDQSKSGITGNEGWAAYTDRGDAPLAGWWRTTWDEWDRRLLRNSAYRIKKLFKSYYYSRDYRPGDNLLGDSESPSFLFLKNLKAAMFPVPGKSMLPWWQRGRLRSSPFNAKGEMCNGKD